MLADPEERCAQLLSKAADVHSLLRVKSVKWSKVLTCPNRKCIHAIENMFGTGAPDFHLTISTQYSLVTGNYLVLFL